MPSAWRLPRPCSHFRTCDRLASCRTGFWAAAKRAPPDTWIWTPRVYPPRLRERRFPTRQELDAAAPHHPVAVDGLYALSLNTLALQAAGVTRASADPPGGAIAKDARGEPTGLLRNVGAMLARFRPSASPVPPLDMLERVHQQYVQTGITSVIERDATVEGYRAYEALQRAGRLHVRATVTFRIPHPEDAAQVERFITGLPLRFGGGDDWLKVGPLKIFVDGGILLGTAFMREPYGLARTICMRSTTPRIVAS